MSDGDPPPSDRITITVRSTDGSIQLFKLKRSTKLGKLKRVFADMLRPRVEPSSLRLRFQEMRILDNHTPSALEMEDGDTIDHLVEQEGGSGRVEEGGPERVRSWAMLSDPVLVSLGRGHLSSTPEQRHIVHARGASAFTQTVLRIHPRFVPYGLRNPPQRWAQGDVHRSFVIQNRPPFPVLPVTTICTGGDHHLPSLDEAAGAFTYALIDFRPPSCPKKELLIYMENLQHRLQTRPPESYLRLSIRGALKFARLRAKRLVRSKAYERSKERATARCGCVAPPGPDEMCTCQLWEAVHRALLETIEWLGDVIGDDE